MKRYTITPVSGVPDWAQIPALAVDQILWLPDCGVRMTQQLCYDGQYLYVRQQAWERSIRAQLTGQLQEVCQDSCMEFFFAPCCDERYFNMEINPNGCVRLGFHGTDMTVLLVPKELERHFALCTDRTEDGWTLEYRIPLDFIRIFFPDFQWKKGTVMRANCYKCGDRTDTPHYLAWNPVSSETPAFHRPQDFGEMIFG